MNTQIDHVSEMVSQSGFALNPSILEKLKRIVDTDIVTYRRHGEVIVATLARETDGTLLRVIPVPGRERAALRPERSRVEDGCGTT